MKKKDRSFRFCVDYRQLNSRTRKVTHPLLKIGDTLDALAGRQRGSLAELDFEVEHRAGRLHSNADELSHASSTQCRRLGAVGGRPAGRLRHSISAAVVGWRELASRMSTRVQPRHALAVAEAAQLGG
ncbi:hypothetical protein T03_12456 [Trichinella britovi]|uniref:Uncharacterized protein n=1 Tax=Trichinella britovi TaxID=45882 RepID=A0A0V1CRT7_TRIBR|nr:hypothetical protein T03_12456 [Trichinella britovi]